MLSPEYSRLGHTMMMIPWLLMPWLLASPGHQQPWLRDYQSNRSFSSWGMDFNLCAISVLRNHRKCKLYTFLCFLGALGWWWKLRTLCPLKTIQQGPCGFYLRAQWIPQLWAWRICNGGTLQNTPGLLKFLVLRIPDPRQKLSTESPVNPENNSMLQWLIIV